MNTQNIARFKDLFCRVNDAYGRMSMAGPEAIREPLTDEQIHAHLEGRELIGAYLVCTEGLSDRLVFDIDTGDADLARGIARELDELDIESYITSSKSRGYHVTAHFHPIRASELRRIGRFIVHRVGTPDMEYFPKQDKRRDGDGLGNFVWLDLHGEYLKTGRTAFLDYENGLDPFPDQWNALHTIQVNPDETVGSALAVVGEWERSNGSGITAGAAPVGEKITESHRNNTLTSIAGSLWRSMCKRAVGSPAALEAALLQANQEKCVPPLDEDEVRTIAASITKYNHDPVQTAIDQSEHPVIHVDEADLPTVAAEVWAAVEQANSDNPYIFRRAGRPVRIGEDDEGRKVFEELTDVRMRHEVSRIASCVRQGKGGAKGMTVEGRLTLDTIRDVLATPAEKMPLSVVSRITDVPMCDPDGNVCATPGYNAGNRTYYVPAKRLRIPEVPLDPTTDDLKQAVGMLWEPFLEFPWQSASDLAHAIAFGLLPFCREMIAGCTPLHIYRAPTPGMGKTKAVQIGAHAATGGNIGIITKTQEEELRKKITTELDRGRLVILFDNIEKMDSANVSAALTAEMWTDRRMAKQEAINVPNRAAWALTGNNVMLSLEIARRSVSIRLSPDCERPWERGGWRYPDIMGWVEQHRGWLVWSNLVLIRSWVAAGRPAWTGRTLGSFEAWSRVMGGILAHAGIDGFLDNLDDLYDAVDLEGAIWREFTSTWWEQFQSRIVGVSDLFPIAEGIDTFDLGHGQERARKTALGVALTKKKDAIFGSYIIQKAGSRKRAHLWRLIMAGKESDR